MPHEDNEYSLWGWYCILGANDEIAKTDLELWEIITNFDPDDNVRTNLLLCLSLSWKEV